MKLPSVDRRRETYELRKRFVNGFHERFLISSTQSIERLTSVRRC